jgi:peptidoglycan/xylan/chitin deacetylase (PgdA/CDA1 family)
MSPEITLEGGDITMKLGTTYDEPGYSAKDDDGNDLTAQVEVSDSNFTKAGDNQISYTVEDSNGNKTRLYRDVTVEPNTNYQTSGVPICMFHYVYDENDPPEDLHKRYGNYISTQALEEELNWLNSEGYYYPTWQEVRDYVDGKLLLPDKSIVLCFDDGAKSFLENGIPVLEKCKVPATCFMITSKDGENKVAKYQSKYVTYESHSDNMHRAGGSIGHGGIFTAISEADGLADLKKSIEICGSGDAFAYPFGDYNDSSEKMVEEAGFLCAVTTEYGKAKPGQDPLLLPRVRMSLGQSLTAFQNKVAP